MGKENNERIFLRIKLGVLYPNSGKKVNLLLPTAKEAGIIPFKKLFLRCLPFDFNLLKIAEKY